MLHISAEVLIKNDLLLTHLIFAPYSSHHSGITTAVTIRVIQNLVD